MEATDETYTAQYFEDKNHSGKDDEDEKITVTFLPGEHGTLEGADAEGKVQTVDLLKGFDSYPSAPTVNANTDWGFKGWDKEVATGAVSYTHLDVYKRQNLHRRLLLNQHQR